MTAGTRRPGELELPVAVHVRLAGQPLPMLYGASSWAAAADYLTSAAFRELLPRLESVVLYDDRDPGERS